MLVLVHFKYGPFSQALLKVIPFMPKYLGSIINQEYLVWFIKGKKNHNVMVNTEIQVNK